MRPPEELLDPDYATATSSRKPPPSSDSNSPPSPLRSRSHPQQQTSSEESDNQNFGNPILISHSAGPKIDDDDRNNGRNPSRTKSAAETSNGAKTSSYSSSQPFRNLPDVDESAWFQEGSGSGKSGVKKLEKPCYELCINVQLHCPFLNPSLASGGRPVFECPALLG